MITVTLVNDFLIRKKIPTYLRAEVVVVELDLSPPCKDISELTAKEIIHLFEKRKDGGNDYVSVNIKPYDVNDRH